MKRQIVLVSLVWISVFVISQANSHPLIDPDNGFPGWNEDQEFDLPENLVGDAAKTMTVTTASVTFDPKRKDKFTLKGTTGVLSLTGASSVILQAGGFSQEIALSQFTQSKQKYTYKGATGAAGVSSLILDMPKGQFSATVQNLFLTGFTNPLPVSLKAGSSTECSMVQFAVNKNKWSFSGSGNPQYACLITRTPQATPKGLFVNRAKEVKIYVEVPSNPDLNPDSISLFRVDENLDVLDGPLCAFSDKGYPVNGDQTSGDQVYSCLANFQEGTAGRIHMMVQAQLGGKPTYSPVFSLDVVTPYTQEEARQTQEAHQEAGQAWQEKLAMHGDTKKARDETVKVVKKLEGVKDAGVTSDGINIWIEFRSGVRGGLSPNQEEGDQKMEAGSWRREAGGAMALPVEVLPCGDAAGETSSVRNCNVLFWDIFARSYHSVDTSVFKTNPGNQFTVRIEFPDPETDAEECGLDSLRQIGGYGTVIFNVIGHKGKLGMAYKTNEEVTLRKLIDEEYMLDLLTGSLETWLGRFHFTPNFISGLGGYFTNSIVFARGNYTSELGPAFMKKEVHTFFGFSELSRQEKDVSVWAENIQKDLFTKMVREGKNTAEAYAALSERSKEGSHFLMFSQSTKGIGYTGEGCYFLNWVEADFPPSAEPSPRGIDSFNNFNEIRYKVAELYSGQTLWVYIDSYTRDAAENKWSVEVRTLKDRAAKSGGEILWDDKDYVVYGYQSTHKDGGYAPGAYSLFYYKGNIIKVDSDRCVYNGYDTDCSDSRIKGLSKEEILSICHYHIINAVDVIRAKCKPGGCID